MSKVEEDLQYNQGGLRLSPLMLDKDLSRIFVHEECKCAYVDGEGYCTRFFYPKPPKSLRRL
jgi:hypothetical protein